MQLPPFHPNRPGLVAPVRRDLAGLAGPTRVQTRGRSWRRSSRGLHARRAVPLVSENSWSPQEVLMQLVWQLDAGRPRPLCNVPVFDRQGRMIATPDLLDPEAGVFGEYEGSLHLAGSKRASDVRREGRLREVGLEGVTMVAADKPDPTDFIRRLQGAYDRARYAPESTRPWTIVPPPWWIPTDTVAARRALTDAQRARLLAHRRNA